MRFCQFKFFAHYGKVRLSNIAYHFIAFGLMAQLLLASTASGRVSCDLNAPGGYDPNACNTPVSDLPPFYPAVNVTLPEPILSELQPSLSSPPLPMYAGNLFADTTVAAWVHVPSGSAVDVFSYSIPGSLYGDGATYRFGVGDTSALGVGAARILNLPAESLPKYFAFYAERSSTGQSEMRSIGLRDVATIDVNGVDWLHVTAGWAFGDVAVYTGGILHQMYDQSWWLNVLNPPFADFGDFQSYDSDSPALGDDKYGGRVGQLAVYQNLITPNLVTQLENTNPFGVPEPSTLACVAIALAGTGCLYRRRLNLTAEL